MANAGLCRRRLKAFVKSDKFLRDREQFEKLLDAYEQSLIEMLDRNSFLSARILNRS